MVMALGQSGGKALATGTVALRQQLALVPYYTGAISTPAVTPSLAWGKASLSPGWGPASREQSCAALPQCSASLRYPGLTGLLFHDAPLATAEALRELPLAAEAAAASPQPLVVEMSPAAAAPAEPPAAPAAAPRELEADREELSPTHELTNAERVLAARCQELMGSVQQLRLKLAEESGSLGRTRELNTRLGRELQQSKQDRREALGRAEELSAELDSARRELAAAASRERQMERRLQESEAASSEAVQKAVRKAVQRAEGSSARAAAAAAKRAVPLASRAVQTNAEAPETAASAPRSQVDCGTGVTEADIDLCLMANSSLESTVAPEDDLSATSTDGACQSCEGHTAWGCEQHQEYSPQLLLAHREICALVAQGPPGLAREPDAFPLPDRSAISTRPYTAPRRAPSSAGALRRAASRAQPVHSAA